MKSTGRDGKASNNSGHSGHYYTWAIALLLVAVFVISQTAPKPMAVFSSGSGVLYKGKQGVSLVCALRYDSNLSALLDQAEQLGVPVAYFVPTIWAGDQRNADQLLRLQSYPNECYLLGDATDPAQLKKELQLAQKIGIDTSFYMPSRDGDAQKLASESRKLGTKIVLCSFDIKQLTTDQADLISAVKQKQFDGSIIRFQPTKTITGAFGDIINTLRLDGAVFTALSEAT